MITDEALEKVFLHFHMSAKLSNHISLTYPTTTKLEYLFKKNPSFEGPSAKWI